MHVADDLGEIVIAQVRPYLDVAPTGTRVQEDDAFAQRTREYALNTLERMKRTSGFDEHIDDGRQRGLPRRSPAAVLPRWFSFPSRDGALVK